MSPYVRLPFAMTNKLRPLTRTPLTPKVRSACASAASRTHWGGLTLEERSAEMKRRAAPHRPLTVRNSIHDDSRKDWSHKQLADNTSRIAFNAQRVQVFTKMTESASLEKCFGLGKAIVNLRGGVALFLIVLVSLLIPVPSYPRPSYATRGLRSIRECSQCAVPFAGRSASDE